MKRVCILLMAIGLLTGAAVSTVRAEETEAKGRVEGQQGRRGGDRGEMQRGGMRGAMNEWIIRRLTGDPKAAAELGLTEEQVKTLKDAADQLQTQREALVKQLTELEQEARTLMEQTPIDEDAVMANLEKISKLRLDMEKASLKCMILVKKTLTPDQTAKLKNMAPRRPEGRTGRRGDAAGGADAPKTDRPTE